MPTSITDREQEIRAEVLGEVTAWLVKKAREHRAQGPQYAKQADVIGTLASKVQRGAVRPDNLTTPPAEGDDSPEDVTALRTAAVEARAALAALCYDLDDPGTAALGALYLLQQATTWVDAKSDEAARVLAKHDADVLHKAARLLEDTGRDDDAVNFLDTYADAWEETGKRSCTCGEPPEIDDSGEILHARYCLAAAGGESR